MALFMTARQPWDEALFAFGPAYGGSVSAPYAAYAAMNGGVGALFASQSSAMFRKPSLEPAPAAKRFRVSNMGGQNRWLQGYRGCCRGCSRGLGAVPLGSGGGGGCSTWASGQSDDVAMGGAGAMSAGGPCAMGAMGAMGASAMGAAVSSSGAVAGPSPLMASRGCGSTRVDAVALGGDEAFSSRMGSAPRAPQVAGPVACTEPRPLGPDRRFGHGWSEERYRDYCTDIVPFLDLRDAWCPRQRAAAEEEAAAAARGGVDAAEAADQGDDDDEGDDEYDVEGFLGAMDCS